MGADFGCFAIPVIAFVNVAVLYRPIGTVTAVSFRAAQFDAGTVAGVQWLLRLVFV
jgi:hypothetical protein